jgi:hypothetical protein
VHGVSLPLRRVVEFTLTTGVQVTKYKEARAEDAGGTELAATFTQGDNHGPRNITVPLVDPPTVDTLVFLKAKTLGAACPHPEPASGNYRSVSCGRNQARAVGVMSRVR